ncbi:hypothetical protein ACFVW8_10545 [Streptomyces sp. NPDC058221]|uniref:hypothetical protein n=1 Tax=Streptomyces sp. NPDC058221 TaxID=3346388 RepID=UPI0036E2A9D8
MTALRHAVTVLALEPARLGELTTLFLDVAESSRAHGHAIVMPDGQPVADVRLVGGHHLRAGARYELAEAGATDKVTLRIHEWRRGGSIAVEHLLSSNDVNTRLTARLACPDRPRLLEAEGRMWGRGAMYSASGKARIDLAAWWAAAQLPPGAPPAARAPATARVKHRLGEARLYLRPRRGDDGRWHVEVAVTLRGRWLLRPVAAVALLLAGGPLRRSFRTGVEQAAEGWNEALGELLALGPDELRAELQRLAAEGSPPQDAKATEDSGESH